MAYQPQPIELLDIGPGDNAKGKRRSPKLEIKLGGEVKKLGFTMDQFLGMIGVLTEYGVDRTIPIMATFWETWELCYSHNQSLDSSGGPRGVSTSLMGNLGRRNAALEKELAEAKAALAAAQATPDAKKGK